MEHMLQRQQNDLQSQLDGKPGTDQIKKYVALKASHEDLNRFISRVNDLDFLVSSYIDSQKTGSEINKDSL
eukprot:CAMPEP_0170565012 /NCGR_PEP_ID=MMETSP0211-20121228/76258_1 /TAXON_ID=311385 /ORGANISM="Pseudokeronopsis sp., Strain OXSARD2" /LENGTH=70 /DNA_ID=CAMNT_0010885247 /DNA_START=51 /DNA_END=260 /DNA_ORIENTATION=-